MQRSERVVYRVPWRGRGWELSDEQMPESVLHDQATELLRQILAWWARGRENMEVVRNLAVRWDEEEPRVGVDPDVCVLSPAPPRSDDGDLRSVRTWLPGHAPPLFAIEVVSTTNPHKDYAIAPEKYAASGTRELVVFDPLLSGPRAFGGPMRLQVWRRDERGDFVRVHEGEGPAYSEVLSAHLVVLDDGEKLRIADDAAGVRLWPTGQEAALAAKEAERAAKEAALARISELEAELRKR